MKHITLRLLLAALVLVPPLHQAGAVPPPCLSFHVRCQATAALPPCVHAVIKIPSHGCSGTIISTKKDYTLILSCAHAFQGKDALKPIRLDVPAKGDMPRMAGKIKLLAVQLDETRGIDLALILLPAGPLPYCCPVAPSGHRPSKDITSVGYRRMVNVSVKVPTALMGVHSGVQYTRERPVPGDSGGALMDCASQRLLGVVIGYEVGRNGRGMYVSHTNILLWLGRYQPHVSLERNYRNPEKQSGGEVLIRWNQPHAVPQCGH